MKTEFKDYHLYLGSMVMAEKAFYPGFMAPLVSALHSNNFRDGIPIDSMETLGGKLVLRPLSDITEEEATKICYVLPVGIFQDNDIDHPFIQALITGSRYAINIADKDFFGITCYLLSRHFDLFGLVENGFAIDATTLNPNPYH